MCVCVCVCLYMCVCICVYMFVCVHMCAYIHIYTRTYIGADLGTVPDVTVPYSTGTVPYRAHLQRCAVTVWYGTVPYGTLTAKNICKDRSVRLCYCSKSLRTNSVNDLYKIK
jgi:hypothetical protein